MGIVRQIMPSLAKREPALWRICWDLITPQQHPIIAKHPDHRLPNLYLSVGGSFHSWKFLPIWGKYIANVLQGRSNGEEKERNWAWKESGWDDPGPAGAHAKLVPKREFRDLWDEEKDGVKAPE